MMDQARRQRLQAAQAEVRELLKPEREAAKIKAAQGRKDRAKAITRTAPEQRQPRLREPLYLAFIRRLPCAVADPDCAGPIEAAHLRFSEARFGRVNSGMQAKPDDRWTVPLCRHHHQHDQHKRNERVFWESRGIDAGQFCLDLHAAFCAGEDGAKTLRRPLSCVGEGDTSAQQKTADRNTISEVPNA